MEQLKAISLLPDNSCIFESRYCNVSLLDFNRCFTVVSSVLRVQGFVTTQLLKIFVFYMEKLFLNSLLPKRTRNTEKIGSGSAQPLVTCL